jgi:short-subunit dehydrogenase
MDALAKEIGKEYPACAVRTVSADLSVAGDVQRVIDAAGDLEVGLLICNAGAALQWVPFLDGDIDVSRKLVAVNIESTLALVHAFGQGMKLRRRGGIMLVGSLASSAGSHGFATYSAVKAFLGIFAEGLWHELRPYDVHVLGYIIGATATPSMARSFPGSAGQGADPASVASQGLAKLADGPTQYPDDGEGVVQMFNSMPRAEAVEMLYQASAPYRGA